VSGDDQLDQMTVKLIGELMLVAGKDAEKWLKEWNEDYKDPEQLDIGFGDDEGERVEG
jgi:hypothetical protein